MMTPGELGAAIAGLRSLAPVDRARTAKELIEEAKAVLAAERAAAVREAVAGGWSVTGLALELGVTRGALNQALRDHGSPPPA